MIKFSIIVPLYNKAPYVRKALESIVAQSYKDWELIIIDDGSTDGSGAICEEYFNSFTPSFVHSFIRQTNSGAAAARNRGVAESHGEFVCFLDADDWWEPNFLEEMEKLITEYPDAGVYATNYIYYKPGKTHVALNLPRGYINYPEAYAKRLVMPVTSITTCMSHRVFDEMGGFPVGIKLGEDFLLWAKTAIHYPIAFCEKPLAYYNNDISASHRATRNLHAPKYNMLFHLDSIEEELRKQSPLTGSPSEWKTLLDKLRVNGLIVYWMSEVYHDVANGELRKVDWSKQPKSIIYMYKKPIWLLKVQRRFMQIGSWCKQKMIRLLNTK